MKKFEQTIAEMYPTLKKFLPRTSCYLMGLYAKDPIEPCKKVVHEYVLLILFSLCNYFKYDKDFTKAYNYAYNNLSDEEFLKKSYLSFTDGKLYDKTYSEEYLYSLIEDAVICFEIPLREIQKTAPTEMDMFMKYLLKTVNHIIKNTDINSDLCCAEYLEQCFITALKNNIEIYFEYQDSLQNK